MVSTRDSIIVNDGLIVAYSKVPRDIEFRERKIGVWHPEFVVIQPAPKQPLEVWGTRVIRPVGDKRLHGKIEDDVNKLGYFKSATLLVYPADEKINDDDQKTIAVFKDAFIPDKKDPNQKTCDVNLDLACLKIGHLPCSDGISVHTTARHFMNVVYILMAHPRTLDVGYETHQSGTQGLSPKYDGHISLPAEEVYNALMGLGAPGLKVFEHFGIKDDDGRLIKCDLEFRL